MKKIFCSRLIATILLIAATFTFNAVVLAAPQAVAVVETASEMVSTLDDTSTLTEETEASNFSSYIPTNVENASLFSESAYNLLDAEMLKFTEKIDVSSFGFTKSALNELNDTYGNVLRMNPYLHYVSFKYSYQYDSKGNIKYVLPIYLTTDTEEIANINSQISSEIDSVLSHVDTAMSDEEKLLVVHDRLLLRGHYDNTFSRYSAKEYLVDGSAVCQGYASAFYAIINKIGIPCGFVASEDMNHIWNSVYIDGAWYHADLTWDDSTQNSPRTNHNYFLKSNEWMFNEGEHYGFASLNNDNSKYDDYFWNNVEYPIIPLAGHMFYIKGNAAYGAISVFNSHTGATTSIYNFKNVWHSTADKKYCYNKTFSGLAYFNGRLYFNTDSQVLSCELDGSDIRVETSIQNADNYSIYGCYKKDGKLHYDIGIKTRPFYDFQECSYVPIDDAAKTFFVVDVFSHNDKIHLSYVNHSGAACNITPFKKAGNHFLYMNTIRVNNAMGTVEVNAASDSFELTVLNDDYLPLIEKISIN